MRRSAPVAIVVVVAAAFTACNGTDADEGRDASMQVAGGQFFRGLMPAEVGGPEVTSVSVASSYEAGTTDHAIIGDVGPAATAVAIGLAGDRGYWVIRAGVPSASATSLPTFESTLSFATTATPGPRELVVRAVDADRRFGPPLTKPLTITERGVAQGELVVSLTWSNHANLDLHVVDPTGAEIFKRDVNSYAAAGPGGPREAPNTPHDGGILDFDSHADCVRDGRRAENVVYAEAPPKGHYLVRVDTFALCGEPGSQWRVQALLHGARIASAAGTSTDSDVTFNHNRGDGILALEFDVP